MSDLGRKDISSQISDKVTPDSQKTTTDKLSENASGAYDKVASAVVPDSEKSTTQKLSDSTRGGADDAQNDGKGLLANAQETASGLAQSASDTAKSAADYVTGKTDEATTST